MSQRTLSYFIIILSVIFLPYWIYLFLIALGVFVFPFYFEAIFFALLVDSIYGAPVHFGFILLSPFSLGAAILVLIMLPVREHLRLNA